LKLFGAQNEKEEARKWEDVRRNRKPAGRKEVQENRTRIAIRAQDRAEFELEKIIKRTYASTHLRL